MITVLTVTAILGGAAGFLVWLIVTCAKHCKTPPRNRYRRDVLPEPVPAAVGPRCYADT